MLADCGLLWDLNYSLYGHICLIKLDNESRNHGWPSGRKLRESGRGVKGGSWGVINSGAILYFDSFIHLQKKNGYT